MADWFGKSVQVLSRDGALMTAIGRPGRGPGEFESIRGLQVLEGDTLFVVDPVQRRVSYFVPPNYSAVEVDNLQTVGTPFNVFRSPRTNKLGLVLRRPVIGTEVSAVEGRLDQVVWTDSEGRPESDPVEFASPDFLATKSAGQLHMTPHPFGAAPHYAIAPDGTLWVAEGRTGAIYSVQEDGRRSLSFTLAGEAPEVTSADIAAHVEGLSAVLGEALRKDVPNRWPKVCGLIVPESGELWICRDGREDRRQTWSLHSPDGVILGRVAVPVGYSLLEVRGNRAAAVARDNFGIPQVGVFRIRRN